MATCRQNRNSLNSITVGDEVIEAPDQVKHEVCSYFSNHFSETWKHRPVLVGDFKSVRLSDHFSLLEAEFSEEEVWAAVADCNGNKAPGPDGFNLLFFQKFWKMLKGEVLNFMKDFHTSGRLPNCFNRTFISLIPKKDKAVTLNEFRPISLVGSVY